MFGGGRGGRGEIDPSELAAQQRLRSSRARFHHFREQSRKGTQPTVARETKALPTASWLQAWRWLSPLHGGIYAVIGLGIVYTLLDAAWPILMGRMINVLEGITTPLPLIGDLEPTAALAVMGVIALATMVISRGLGFLRSVLLHRLSLQTAHRLRTRLHECLLHLPLSKLSEIKTGGIVARLSTDVDNTAGLLQQAFISPLLAAIRLVVVLTILVMYSWQLTGISMGLLIIMGLIHHRAVSRIRPLYRSSSRDRAFIDGRVAETFGGIRVVRSFVREPRERLDFTIGHDTVLRKQVWARLLLNLYHSMWELLLPVVNLLIIWLGGLWVLEGNLTIGAIFTIQVLSFQVMTPVMQLIQAMSETQRGLASLDRVREVLALERELPDRANALPAPKPVESIHIEQCSFRYPARRAQRDDERSDHQGEGSDEWVLRDINLTIRGGEVCALVGPSGAGKSTLVDLITRMMDPTDGRILLNGIDLRDLRLHSYRSLLGVVSQETFLFDGTVRENIGYGNRFASDAEIIAAAQQANAWEFINTLPDGLDTFIGERGVKVSGGQRQRLAIARAILADPAILIFDEATSSLDSANEQAIQASINNLMQGRTTILIAHRLATIRDAHHIAVLVHGRIVEQGTHQTLIHKGPGHPYHDMVRRQEL